MLTVEYGQDALPILVLVVVWVFEWVAVNVICSECPPNASVDSKR